MLTVYIYILDTLADWELGHVMTELNSGRFFKVDASRVSLKMVGSSLEPITTMGGITLTPDLLLDDMTINETSMLLLPGADTWNEPKHHAILEKVSQFLSAGVAVGAICGASLALANFGLLDERPHTSNGPGFLELFSPNYKGQNFYIDELSVVDENLITAGSAGSLLWAKQIIAYLGVFQTDTLESWYHYFSTGDVKHFMAMMQTLPSSNH